MDTWTSTFQPSVPFTLTTVRESCRHGESVGRPSTAWGAVRLMAFFPFRLVGCHVDVLRDYHERLE